MEGCLPGAEPGGAACEDESAVLGRENCAGWGFRSAGEGGRGRVGYVGELLGLLEGVGGFGMGEEVGPF